MGKIRGIKVTLISKQITGHDPFGAPILSDVPIMVDNVLITPTTSEEIINRQELYGKKAVYTLAIPKGDTNKWEDVEVEFFGKRWRTFGIPEEGIEHLIPLDWNKKVTVECYE